MARAWQITYEDVESFIDPFFGCDPYFDLAKANKGLCYNDKEAALKHLQYMLGIVWPLITSFRKVLVGQRDMTTYTAIGRFAVGDRDFKSDGRVRRGFGHIYLKARPGTGKSLLAKTPALVLGGKSSRFQGMAGTLPADYTGKRIIQIDPVTQRRIFELVPGPGFSEIQILDEFLRSDERTQGAVLEALGEGTITIDGVTHQVDPFALITGNPIETRGVYPAIAAFLDRIMFTLRGQEFTEQEFSEILRRTGGYDQVEFRKVCENIEKIKEVQEFFDRNIYVSEEIQEKVIGRFAAITNAPHPRYLKKLCDEFDGPIILGGFSGRGVGHWQGAAKVLAAIRYQNFVTPEELRKVLLPVLRHRMIFAPNVLNYFSYARNLRIVDDAADMIINELIKEAW